MLPQGGSVLDVTGAPLNLHTIALSPVGRQDTFVTSSNAAGPQGYSLPSRGLAGGLRTQRGWGAE